jgi:hypothetical protein
LSVLGAGCETCGAPTIEPKTLPDGTVGKSYRKELSVECRDGGWSLSSGELPPGIQFDDRGVLSGIPSLAGTYVFTVGMVIDESDENGGTEVNRGYSLVVLGPDGEPAGGAGGG